MGEYLFWDLGWCAGGAQFEVRLDGCAANVFLVDVPNFSAYEHGNRYRYHGGFYDFTPIVVEVPHDEDWVLVVDGYDDTIAVEFDRLD